MVPDKDRDSNTAAPIERRQPLNCRFDFNSYGATRRFLDRLSDLSKRDDYYPNINFGKTYVNVSIDAEGQMALGERQTAFFEAMKTYAAEELA